MQQYEAEVLRQLVERIHHGGAGGTGLPAPADFYYVDLDTDSSRTIPGVQFRRQYQLHLHSLELTFHGYAIRHRFDRERGMETAFSTHPPMRWRRLLQAPHSIALRIDAGPRGTSISVGTGEATRAPSAAAPHLVVRLDQAMQEHLAQARVATPPVRSVGARLLSWLTGWINPSAR